MGGRGGRERWAGGERRREGVRERVGVLLEKYQLLLGIYSVVLRSSLIYKMNTQVKSHSKGPILHSAQLTLYTGACTIPILHPTHVGIFPQPAQVLNLGSELALRGNLRSRKKSVALIQMLF